MNYKAGSLEDIARMFDTLAQSAKDASARAATKIAAVGCKREAHAYMEAASVLRATTLENTPSEITALQFGFRSCEKGMNIQQTEMEFAKIFKR